MKQKQRKEQRGRKDDRSLHRFLERLQRERRLLGIEERPVDLKAAAERWRQSRAQPALKSPKANKRLIREFLVISKPAPDGGYLAYCPAVPDHYARGDTPQDARARLVAHLSKYLTDLAARGEPLPKEDGRLQKVKVAVAMPE